MIKTNLARDHALWNQIMRKENGTRQQFEYMTGQTQADRFFSGTNKPFVDNTLKKCTDWRFQAETDYANALQAASAQRLMKNQGELFTQALSEVLEKQKQNNTARRRRYNSEHKPHQSQTIRSDKSQVGSAAITRPHTPLTLALTKHREYFSPYKVSHTDQNGNVIRFADIKTKGYPFEIKQYSMPYNPNRMSHVDVINAIADPNQTISDPKAQPKRYGYTEVPLKPTIERDRDAKEIKDYAGRSIIKVDINPQVELTAKHWMQYSMYPTAQKTVGRANSDFDWKNVNRNSKNADSTCQSEYGSRAGSRSGLKRKLQLMKLMLKNEKQANNLIKRQIDTISTEIHTNNKTIQDIARVRH